MEVEDFSQIYSDNSIWRRHLDKSIWKRHLDKSHILSSNKALCTCILIIYNYFTGKVKGILLYQGFLGCFLDKIGLGSPWLCKIFNFPKKYLYTVLSSFEKKTRIFSWEPSQIGWLFYITVPRDVKYPNLPLFGGIIGQ